MMSLSFLYHKDLTGPSKGDQSRCEYSRGMIAVIGSNKNTEMSSDGTMCTHSLAQRAHFCTHERAPRKLAYGTGLDAPEYLGVDFASTSNLFVCVSQLNVVSD